jgi:hypothetical protein
VVRFDGARCTFLPDYKHTSNNIFVYVEHQLNQMLGERGEDAQLDILAWKTIDDEATEHYLAFVQFGRNLERALGAEELWPRITLAAHDVAELEQRLSRICRPLRNECFLPDWEYSAEHKVPIIPEPLAFASISRSERRADPLASMGLTVGVVLGAVGVLALLIAFPPWVPGS